MERITGITDENLSFVLELLKFQGAKTSIEKEGSTWTVTVAFPDGTATGAAAALVLPSQLATDTVKQAAPASLPTAEPVKPPMPGVSFAELEPEYRRNYDLFRVEQRHEKEIGLRVEKVLAGRERYMAITKLTGVPWHFIGVLHMMEANCSFSRHLHNGDPLTERTTRAPVGLPAKGNPPFTWEASAVDALEYEGFTNNADWNVATMLYRSECYNGMGYRSRGIYSPYLWSYCNLYTKGRFIKDHVFDPESVSQQCGVAILLKRLLALA